MRAVRKAVLLTATASGLGVAAPALAGTTAHPTTAVAPAPVGGPVLGLCVDLDVRVLVRLRLVIGACRSADDPPKPDPPKPSPTRPPGSVTPRPPSPRPAPQVPAAPVATRPPSALPATPEPTPSATTRQPTPSSSTRAYREPSPRAMASPRRKRHPLGTIVVFVVLATVIASGAGLAFAARR
ncbi:hypothetical protein [Actinomadura alba]|uniref:Uncharacterized protein n=1 Tax=Actinomadura alba TaxID=406431 RepID=A0ABR7LRF1_9ACTN|nr:hypothetical protein [Actinomadura alba]MBC6466993.1 hypothetical protein [Actinomadura alba]